MYQIYYSIKVIDKDEIQIKFSKFIFVVVIILVHNIVGNITDTKLPFARNYPQTSVVVSL